jgi:phosphonate transport system permease protein
MSGAALPRGEPPVLGVPQRRPLRNLAWLGLVLGLLVLASVWLTWDFTTLATPESRAAAAKRLGEFVGALAHPDLDADYLRQCLVWSHETVTTALAGTLVGLLLGWTVALGASRAFVLDALPPAHGPLGHVKRALLRTFVEGSRLVLDVLRGVPDFVWAVVLLPALGTGRLTGTLAIGLSVAGILGKVYSELWDAVPARRLEPLRQLGPGRLAGHLYATQPTTARAMMSFTLMRAECAIRNASVLGVIVGGGLGGAIDDELSNGDYARVGTLVLFVFAITSVADLLSNLLRRQFRNDPNHPRVKRASPRGQLIATWIGVALAVAVFGWAVADHLRPRVVANSNVIVSTGFSQPAVSDVQRALDSMADQGGASWLEVLRSKYLVPDLSGPTVQGSLESALTPLSVAFIATLLGMLLAIGLAWMGSVAYQLEPHRFTGERAVGGSLGLALRRSLRWIVFGLGKLIALVARSVPELLWALILIRLLSLGAVPGILAIGIHSMGVLARVFTETVDNIPYRRLEQTYLGSRRASFVAVAAPTCWRDWLTYTFFQFESNVRMGVVLGLVGLEGLGKLFNEARQWAIWGQASTLLLVMILLTTLIDRTSRALKLSRGAGG